MRFCGNHWQQLQDAIAERGLSSLVADSGEQAVRNMASEIKEGSTIDNFDPLMGAHNFIWSGAMSIASTRYNANPLMMMAEDPEHPEWQCPICFLNWLHAEHDKVCTKEGCDYPKGFTYDEEAISLAADQMLMEWRKLGGNT
jgi:hypothetical protein